MYNIDSKQSLQSIDPHRYDIAYNPYFSTSGINNHSHGYSGNVINTQNHNHGFEGKTLKTIKRGNTHIHYYEVTIDSNDDNHKIFGETGPSINKNGNHIHFLKGITTPSRNHIHFYEAYTSTEKPKT